MHASPTPRRRRQDRTGRAADLPGEIEVATAGPAHGGACVARHQGRVVFVRHALPGEQVRARVTEVRPGYWRADAVEVLSPSPDRVSPPCPYAGPGGCGGCDWQHAAPSAARRLKAEVVATALRRQGLQVPVEVAELPGGPLGWRTRVELAVDARGRAGLRRHRGHAVVAVQDCLLAHPQARLPEVLAQRWPPGATLRVVASGSGERSVLLRHPGGVFRSVTGPTRVREPVPGGSLKVPAAGFWQVHPGAPAALLAAVLPALGPLQGRAALDLYAGAGLFAHALARAGAQVSAVEADPASAAAARANLAGLPARVVGAAVEGWLGAGGGAGADLVVLDPPRSGPTRGVAAQLAQLPARTLAYVSCDPSTLARDLGVLLGAGWRLASLSGLDAFPMTGHVECVAVLGR